MRDIKRNREASRGKEGYSRQNERESVCVCVRGSDININE